MTLPAIDIPFKLPFDVPLLVHPIFVHFAVAIPIIVLLIELVNLKARNRAVSLTSLFLLTLAMIVYVGAFYTGKADGSEAFALLNEDAKNDLKFHKLLGTYLVYGTGVLFLLKVMAMAIKQNWARTLFLLILVVFLGLLLKQGEEGGELVYKHGVNVKPVSELQDKIDDLQYDIDDLKAELQKAKAECAAKEKSETAPVEPATEPKSETPTSEAPSETEPAAEPTSEATEKMKKLQESLGEVEKNATETIEHAVPENTTPVHIPTH
jgi:uncharacterized membrane protein